MRIYPNATAMTIRSLARVRTPVMAVLIALAATILAKRKSYYATLEASNKKNDITDWLLWFAATTIEAQRRTIARVEFLIDKTRLLDSVRGQLNERFAKDLGDGWRRFTRDKMPFRPTKRYSDVKFVRVLVLPVWPPGVSYLDNVRLTEYEEK